MPSRFNFGGNRIRRRRNRPRIFRFGGGGHVGGRLFPRSRFTSSWFNFNVNNPKVIDYDSSEEKEENVKPSAPIDSVLRVSNCNYNITQNTDAHHTDEYDITEPNTGRDGPVSQLVVRRGQPFDITLTFTRPYGRKKDDLKLVFEFGENPTPINGTYVDMILSDKDEPLEWGAKIKDQSGKTLTVTIMTPPTLYVGKWEFKVEALEKSDTETCVHRYNNSQPIYILFNPWCKDDAVFMPEQNLLDEYILNQTGKIYVGNQRRLCGRRWNFGQFEGNILDCALYLLGEHEDVPMKDEFRGDPVKVTRKLSALVNCQDDEGVLTGNWSGDYSGGKAPTKWSGSVAILEEFYSTKEPVCFGQCWVFSGVLTTICRTLGIPARSVTNFASAHDTDESITIDKIYDGEGDELDSTDSIWNFHVWNDVWMDRQDLPKGYGGWQALDATPQEVSSNGVFCCGPFPLTALKKGEVNIPYDGSFIFAEVNADLVRWVMQPDGSLKKKAIEKDGVGKFISTKLPVCRPRRTYTYKEGFPCWEADWEDVTIEYKHEEGSLLERKSVKNANRKGSNSCKDLYDQPENEDVSFDIKEKEFIMYGQDFEVLLHVQNKSKALRTVDGCINVNTHMYTGQLHRKVKKQLFKNVEIKPGENITLRLPVTVDEYMDKLAEQCQFDLCELFTVQETRQTSVKNINFRLFKPELTLKAPAEGEVGKTFKVDVSFTNPLPVSLSCCELSIEGPGLQKPIVHKKRNVGSHATYTDQFELTPAKKGNREIIVSFNAKEIEMVEGSCEMLVKPSK